jgi:nitronate monooxygenase
MPFPTRVTTILGIQVPIVMGGMTGTGTPELAAAVSNAGGLGIFAAHNAGSPEGCREWIRRIRALTNKPFGVNLTILPTMSALPYDDFAAVIIEEKVPIVETAGSNPKKWITLFKSAGLVTIHKCVTIRHALSAQRLGVDIISLDGFECAGHPGEDDVGNFLLQAKGGQVLTTPYICSGGVGTGKQLVAALAMGAEGVNVGTALCVTQESNWPLSFKQRVVDADERSTVLMFRKLHNTARVFKNAVASEVHQIEEAKGNDIQFTDVMHLVMGKRGREAEARGDADGGIWSAGQVCGLINDIPTVQQFVDRMVADGEAAVRALQSFATPTARL